MFYLCNRSGLRTGEAAGLRISDMDFIDEGVLRARTSYDGPLKEDKKGEGKVKWVPAPEGWRATTRFRRHRLHRPPMATDD